MSQTFINSRSMKQRLKNEADLLLKIHPSDRPWHLPLLAAITISTPIFIGAIYAKLPLGILASLGAMIVLNLPASGSLWQRQSTLCWCALMMITSFAAGLLASSLPSLRLPIFAIVTFSVVVFGRYWRLPPPAGMFMIMAAAIALFMPTPFSQLPQRVGVVAMGSGFAWLMALLYNVSIRGLSFEASLKASKKAADDVRPGVGRGYEPALITKSVIVTVFVVLALAAALLLDLSHPYWVPVSCFIIIQGMHLHTMWIKQLHRLLGTAAGLIVAWLLLALSLPPLGVAAAIAVMMFWIETMVVRHYGLAVVVITPLTIFIAEFGRSYSEQVAQQGMMHYHTLIQARFWDTALGCMIALLGGLLMHSIQIQRPLVRIESKLIQYWQLIGR